ncbi:1-hydroxy-2-methyl-2-butenyl 4-diphosphate reductase [Streptomyces sp. A7024]|uniref:1-hydroxy-2-methyl-2-butenyl 4-diphosphate reductase n=1 Tax=Streptomyces coryli TaxID=1128680 RepID=A0A6G4TTT1_9ACTN|nr:1-hydroxy-2-methyl-2-butenyl 4-diphosphate reductase [Streptomyces coryli]NGN62401.1 1-hydroxy-2-methyl-2-butenyl 4-diphosphate reductase [Streptomyces coryli]
MPNGPVPLLIACALGIERRALRAGLREGAAGPVALVRTGMGPKAAEKAVAEQLAQDTFTDSPVIATGFCAGLVPGMRPGDVFVAEATEDAHGRVEATGNQPLAEALELLGATVHTGLLTGSDHVVRGAERARLRAAGAAATDMESAATLRTARKAGPRPVAAVRVIVDAPEHELIRIGTVRGGITACRVLSSVLPAFYEWHRTLPPLPRR